MRPRRRTGMPITPRRPVEKSPKARSSACVMKRRSEAPTIPGLDERGQTMTVREIIAACRRRFGSAPSQSAIYRFFERRRPRQIG